MNSRASLVLPAVIVVLTLGVYTPAFEAGFIWDDDDYVSENPLLRDADGLLRIWTTTETPQYYPMVFTTFWLEHQLWGLAPAGYHVVNVLLHALNAILLGYALRLLSVPGAWWVAVLFAVHPVQVESVAWVTERKNVLSGLFYLLSSLSFLRFERDRRTRHYLLSLATFVLALLSKTVTASLPVALGLALLWRNGRLRRADVLRLVPYVLLGAGLALITVGLESEMIRAVRSDFDLSWWQRLLIAGGALLFYPWKLVVPYPLIFNYPRWDLAAPAALYAALVVVCVVCVALSVAWRRGRRGVVLAALFYGATIFPVLGFLDVYPFRYSFVADHFQYLASVGPLIVLVGLGRASSRWLCRRAPAAGPAISRAAGAAIVAALALLGFNQASIYHDLPTLWQHTIAHNPRSWLALHNMGLFRMNAGDLDAALSQLDRAIEAKPASAESYTARGLTRYRAGDQDAALADLNRAVELQPSYPQARLNRGNVLLDLGRPDLAIADLEIFVDANRSYLPARHSLARALLRMKRYAEAAAHLDEIVRRGPDYEAFLNRGVAQVNLERYERAVADFTRALELRPGATDAWSNRAFAYVRLGRPVSALEDLDRSIALDGDNVRLFLMRGGVHQTLGDMRRACMDWQQACARGDCRLLQQNCFRGGG
ncbi:MAG TPA: tetratricopeptide repeat protein [Candidatus Polarisedimenticolaceae bacterium]|nr:tetratricopeptide repeat protein [Candidatus Polarisedimenticolaceae bacterium]